MSADEAAWRAIVDNYGDRPEIASRRSSSAPPARLAVGPIREESAAEDPTERPSRPSREDHYVPPPPPPLPDRHRRGCSPGSGCSASRCSCWSALVAGVNLPTWLGLILMVWFVGGFVYLVASMRPGAGDDYDDGAVL